MMSQINAPIHNYKRAQKYFQVPVSENHKLENIFFLANETRYIDSGLDSERPNEYLFNTSFNQNRKRLFLSNFNFNFNCNIPPPIFPVYIFGGGKRMSSPSTLHPNQVASSCIGSNSQSKCVSVCKISPEIGRGILSADLSNNNVYLAIPQQCILRGSTPSLFTDHVCSGKSTSWANTSVTENFIKIKFFDFKSNFDQATQKN